MASIDIDIAVDCDGEHQASVEASGEQSITIEIEGEFECEGLRSPRGVDQADGQIVVIGGSQGGKPFLPILPSVCHGGATTGHTLPTLSLSEGFITKTQAPQTLVPKARVYKSSMHHAICQVHTVQPTPWNQYCSGANLPKSQWNYIRRRKKNPVLEDCYRTSGTDTLPCKNTV